MQSSMLKTKQKTDTGHGMWRVPKPAEAGKPEKTPDGNADPMHRYLYPMPGEHNPNGKDFHRTCGKPVRKHGNLVRKRGELVLRHADLVRRGKYLYRIGRELVRKHGDLIRTGKYLYRMGRGLVRKHGEPVRKHKYLLRKHADPVRIGAYLYPMPGSSSTYRYKLQTINNLQIKTIKI